MRAGRADRLFARFRRTRDPAAVAALFDATAPELLRVARYLAGDAHAAEDLVQSTFLVALEDAGQHDGARRVLPWLLGILANRARELRKQHGRAVDPQRVARPAPPDPADEAARAELEHALARALGALPSPYGEVLALHLEHGLNAQAIAAALRRPPGTVRTQIVRGMELLRAALPAGFAATACAAVAPAHALERVREAVLAHAKDGAAVTGTAALALLSGVATMQKVSVAVVVLALAGMAWWVVSPALLGSSAHESDGDAAPLVRVALLRAGDDPAEDAAPPEPEPARSTLGAADSTNGALRLALVWDDDGSAAASFEVFAWQRAGDSGNPHRQTSDALGVVAFDGLAPGAWRVRCGATTQDYEVVPGETTQATLRVRGVVIDGIVVDPSGAAVAGASIQCCPSYECVTLTTTRADGTFAWRGAYASEVWAEKEGYVPSRVQYTRTEGGTPCHLQLELGAAGVLVTGVVLDGNDAPAGGAVVALSVDDAAREPRAADGSLRRRPAPVMMRADREGRFATRSAVAGEHALAACAPGWAPVVTFVEVVKPPPDREPEPIVVRLTRGATVRGVVRDAAGKPIAGSINCWWSEPIPGLWPFHRVVTDAVSRTKADEQGRYELHHLLAGKLRLWAMSNGYGHAETIVHLREKDEHEWNPVVHPAGVIAGRVIDPEDRPVAGFRVRATARSEAQAQTDGDGRFLLEGLQEDSFAVVAMPAAQSGAAARLPWTKPIWASTGKRDLVLRTLVAPGNGVHVVGRLVGVGGERITAGAVRVYPEFYTIGTDGLESVDDAEGRFRIGPISPGVYTFNIEATGHGWVSLEREARAGETLDLGAVVLEACGTLTIVVRDRDGAKVDDAVLRFGDERSWFDDWFEKIATGAWRSRPFPPGTRRVEVWGPGVARAERSVEIEAGRDAPVEVTVERATPVQFVLEQPEPRAVHWTEFVRLTLRDPHGSELETTFQIDGRARFTWTRGLSAGTYGYVLELLRRNEPRQATGSFTVPDRVGEPVEVHVRFP